MPLDKTSAQNPYKSAISTLPDLILDTLESNDLNEIKNTILQKSSGFPNLVCELGCGSGGHMHECAKICADTFYFGFEMRFKRIFKSAEKAKLANLKNICVLRANAKDISSYFAQESLNGVYVNFPDPWERRRWTKHRMLNEESQKTIFQ